MLSDALYKSGVDDLVKLLVNSTSKRSIPTFYYLLNTTVEALRLPFWREVSDLLLQVLESLLFVILKAGILHQYAYVDIQKIIKIALFKYKTLVPEFHRLGLQAYFP